MALVFILSLKVQFFYFISFRDEKHSTKHELRWNVISMTAQYGLICLTFTECEDDTVKFITAWKAEKWMQNEYKNQ